MSASIYHVRKVSLGLKRKYRISADDGAGKPGASLGYAEKQLTVTDELPSIATSSALRRW